MTPRSASCWGATPHGAGTPAKYRGAVLAAVLRSPRSRSRHSLTVAESSSWDRDGGARQRSLVSAPIAQGAGAVACAGVDAGSAGSRVPAAV